MVVLRMKSKYVVITDNGILSGYSLKLLNKKHKMELNETDFKVFGGDRVLYIGDKDISYQRDLNYLSQIPISKLYTVDKKPFYIQIVNFIMTMILFIQITGIRSLLMQLVEFFSSR